MKRRNENVRFTKLIETKEIHPGNRLLHDGRGMMGNQGKNYSE